MLRLEDADFFLERYRQGTRRLHRGNARVLELLGTGYPGDLTSSRKV